VAATYKTIAGTRNAIVTLTDKTSIVSIYKSAYLHCAPPAGSAPGGGGGR